MLCRPIHRRGLKSCPRERAKLLAPGAWASAVSGRSANRAAEPLRRLIVRYPGVKAICFDVMIPDARGRKGQTDTATSYAARGTFYFGLF